MMDIVPGNLYRLLVDHWCYTLDFGESVTIAEGELVLVTEVSRPVQGDYILTILWDSKIFRFWTVGDELELVEEG